MEDKLLKWHGLLLPQALGVIGWLMHAQGLTQLKLGQEEFLAAPRPSNVKIEWDCHLRSVSISILTENEK
jgi:hypothetical protein